MSAIAETPLISLIVIVHNGAGTIDRALESVKRQTYAHYELLVLDAASTDGTQAIIEQYRDILTYYHSRPDNGPYDAFHQSFALAKGDIIGLLNADDWLSPEALAEVVALYHAHPHAQIFSFGIQEHQLLTDGTLAPGRYLPAQTDAQFTLADGLYCHGLTQFYARDVIAREGSYKVEQYPQLADREFYIRLGLQNLPRAGVDKPLYHFLVHPQSNSMSGNIPKTAAMLAETLDVARNCLKRRDIDAAQRRLFARWYSFNAVRTAWFQWRARQCGAAVKTMLGALRQPLELIAILRDHRLPPAFRPRHG